MPNSLISSDRIALVAEVGQAHDGSLGTAHAFIDACAQAGADAIKFQTHIADAESHPSEPWRVRFSKQDVTRFDYWKRMEFTPDQWAGLYEHAHAAGLQFVSSPFSIEAVELLTQSGIDAWKIASGEVTNIPLLERVASDGRPVLLSSGMTTWAELDRAVDLLSSQGAAVTVLQCTSSYPCPPELTGLNVIPQIRERYGLPSGLSDHSGTIFPSLGAATLGAELIEVHVTLSKHAFGPDVPASLTIPELGQLRQGLDCISVAMANPVDKDEVAAELTDIRQLFTRSIIAARRIPAGATLTDQDLSLKKPGTGMAVDRIGEVIGTVAARTIEPDTFISEADLLRQDSAT